MILALRAARRKQEGAKNVSLPLAVNDNVELFNCRFEAVGRNVRDEVLLAWLGRLDRVKKERPVITSRKPMRKNG